VQKVLVNKAERLFKVKANRDQHRKIFLEAMEGFRKAAIKRLDEMIAIAKSGKKIELYVSLTQPEDHTKDYDRVISMVEMSVEKELMLFEEEFSHYVLDDWDWKEQFLGTTQSYMAH